MSDLSTKVHRCCQCHAALPLERAVEHVVRCKFCGTDHSVSSAKANQERELHQERRLGGLVAPYVMAPLIAFFGYLAYRDFLFAPYEGRPAMLVAICFVVIGLMGFRMAAVVGLALIGVAGVLKPFVRGIPSWDDASYMSPTSETAFYYLIPGALAMIAAFLFFASLRVRELRPALHALMPRYTVAAVALAGALGARFVVGDSIVEVVREYRSNIEAFETLALKACDNSLEEALETELDPAWQSTSSTNTGRNSIYIACGVLRGDTSQERDPLHLDQMAALQRTLAGRTTHLHQGATDANRAEYRSIAMADYLVVVDSRLDHIGYLISTKSGKVVRKARVIKALNGSSGAQHLLAVLRGEVAAALPSRLNLSPTSKPPPPPPPEASYTHHSTLRRGDATWFFGIVTNTGTVALSKPEILVIYKDEEGKELGSTHGYGAYDLEPGESCPATMLDTEAPEYASTEFELNLRPDTSGPGALGLSLSEHEVKLKKNGVVEIVGKVKNQGKTPARFVEVFLSAFDSNDKLIDTRSTFSKSDSLAAGGEARFMMQVYGIPVGDQAPRYEFAVRGQVDTR